MHCLALLTNDLGLRQLSLKLLLLLLSYDLLLFYVTRKKVIRLYEMSKM